ncbi:hypothetical protein RJ640_013561 [Escallonia rubra]|uniref:Protein NRT1/ PTR FAMILY 1.2-like n=1 Tax=Escallonia rubra TaxID=112253 RepID=A0AA88UCD2_9ASTE|nr:hypothetical protein RJ640_013561 [Escallonia rubra]
MIPIFKGMTLLWSTTMISQARPPPCKEFNSSCSSATTLQLILLFSAFGLMSIGAGGIRSSSLAFGADQLDKRDNLKSVGALESYFSWYYASISISVIIAFSCVVYLQENMGWEVGFGVPAVLMFASAVSFLLASPFYVKLKAKASLFTGFVQVIAVSYRNRHIALSSERTDMMYHHKKGSMLLVPSEKLRWLNKACIIKVSTEEGTLIGRTSDSWNVCTVDQVEELKALLKVVPLWSAGMIMSVNISQTSFAVLQATSMDRHITSSFQIPSGSFGMFTVISVIVWVALYDRVILPVASRIMKRPARLDPKQRMGVGIFFSFLAMVVTAIVEYIRRGLAIKEGYANDPLAVVRMSALWLLPQHCLTGLAEAMNAIGQNEFYFSEFPRSMSSVATTLVGVGMAGANLLASFIMTTIDQATGEGGAKSWISSNINEGHYDYYYWVLAGLSFSNTIYFLVCSKAYGPCEGHGVRVWLEGDEPGDE